MDAWGEEAKQLFGFFSAVVCVYLPYKQSKWEDEDGIEMDGMCNQPLNLCTWVASLEKQLLGARAAVATHGTTLCLL